MHELSIADAVVTIASRHAAGRKVTRVDLKVGHLRQVVPDSLTFAFELVSAGTELEGRGACDRGGAGRCGVAAHARPRRRWRSSPLHCGRAGAWTWK